MSYNPYDPQSLDALTGMYESAGALQAKQIAQKYKIDQQSLANQMKIAAMESGDRRAQIEATREYQRGQLEQARQEMLQIGIPKVQVDQFTAQANAAIAAGELQTKQYLAQSQNAAAMGQLQQARDEMQQVGIPQMLINRFTAESQAAIEQGKLGLSRDEMLQIGIPDMLTRRYSAEAQSAYQQAEAATGRYGAEAQAAYQRGQLGLTAQQQQQAAIEQQRRYALDVAKYGTDLMSQPDRYFQAAQFGAMAPRLLGLQAGAAPTGGPTSGVAQMGNLLSQALAGMGPQQAAPFRMPRFPGDPGAVPDFPTMPGYQPPPLSQMPAMPTMTPYTAPALSPLPSFPSGGFAPINMPTAPWSFPTTQVGGMPAPTASPAPTSGYATMTAGGGAYPETGYADPTAYKTAAASDPWGGYLGTPGQGVGLSSDQGGTAYVGGVDLGGMMGSGSQSDLAAQWAAQYGYPSDPYGGAGGYSPSMPSYGNQGGYGYPGSPGSPAGGTSWDPYGAYGSGDQSDLSSQWASQYGYSTGQGTYGGPSAGASPSYYQPYDPSRPTSYGSDDPRIKQLADVAKASPPSPYDGLSDTDATTLRLMESIYKQGGQAMAGGEYERLGTAQKGFLSSAGTLLGYDPNDLVQTYKQYRPTQDDSRLAG